MNKAGLDYAVELKPWERCLKEIKVGGQGGRAELIIGAAFNEERAAFAHFTQATHASRSAIFYSETRFPEGIDWASPQDTERFVVCVVRGFNYTNEIPSDSTSTLSAKSVDIAIQHMRRGRCEILFSSIEPIFGTKLYGGSTVPAEIRYLEYDTEDPNDYHIMVSKASPRGKALAQRLDAAIAALIADGTRDRIFDGYYQQLSAP
ncbi:MAG: hypothetical protein ACPGOY_17640 [Rhodospirillaceae bacterium]